MVSMLANCRGQGESKVRTSEENQKITGAHRLGSTERDEVRIPKECKQEKSPHELDSAKGGASPDNERMRSSEEHLLSVERSVTDASGQH